MTLRRALFGFLAAGCLFLLIEMIDSHDEVENSLTWLPVTATSLASAVSLAAFVRWRERRLRLALQGVSVLLIVVGVLGFFLHTGGTFSLTSEEGRRVPPGRGSSFLYGGSSEMAPGVQAFDGDEEEDDEEGEGEDEEDEGKAPPLAPLSLAGVGILGLMAASLREDRAGKAAPGQRPSS